MFVSRTFDRAKVMALLPKQGEWFRIANAAGPAAEVYIYDEISLFGITADQFVQEINAIAAPEIRVHINCKGGDVFDGIAIYNALRSHSSKVTTVVDSLAASIASVIAQAGDERLMVTHSQMMIHDAFAVAIGDAKDFRAFADLLDKQSDLIAGIYSDRSGGDQAAFRDLMRTETWLSDQETVDLGLADRLEDPAPVQDSKDTPSGEETPAPVEDRFDWSQVFSEVRDDEMELLGI